MLASRHRTLTVALLIFAGLFLNTGSSVIPSGSSGLIAQGAENRVDVLIGFRGAPNAADEGIVRGAGGRVTRRYQIVTAVAANIPERAVAVLQAHARIFAECQHVLPNGEPRAPSRTSGQ